MRSSVDDRDDPGETFAEHRAYVDKVTERQLARRKKPGPKRKKPKRISRRERERRARLAEFSTAELYGELARRSNAAQKKAMTPERRRETVERIKATWRLRRELCLHENARPLKHTPKVWYCPDCTTRIPRRVVAKVKSSGELETVT